MDAAILKNKSPEQLRLATSVFFFISGFGYSTWASRIPSIQQHLHLNEAQLGDQVAVRQDGLRGGHRQAHRQDVDDGGRTRSLRWPARIIRELSTFLLRAALMFSCVSMIAPNHRCRKTSEATSKPLRCVIDTRRDSGSGRPESAFLREN